MAKHKKKHAKKSTDDLFDTAAASVKKFRKVTREIGKLSPGQKLLGGLALLAGGLLYLNKLKGALADEPGPAPRFLLPPAAGGDEGDGPASRGKIPKAPKPRKSAGPSARVAD